MKKHPKKNIINTLKSHFKKDIPPVQTPVKRKIPQSYIAIAIALLLFFAILGSNTNNDDSLSTEQEQITEVASENFTEDIAETEMMVEEPTEITTENIVEDTTEITTENIIVNTTETTIEETTAATTEAQIAEATVWIPSTGSKYHSKSSCSNMKNPTQVKISEAERRGYTPCKRCY